MRRLLVISFPFASALCTPSTPSGYFLSSSSLALRNEARAMHVSLQGGLLNQHTQLEPTTPVWRVGRRTPILFAAPPSLDEEDQDDTALTTKPDEQGESLRQKMFADLQLMRQQFAELTSSLRKAKQDEAETSSKVKQLEDEKQKSAREKEEAILKTKQSLGNEMMELADELEETQDGLRQIVTKTGKEIESIQEEAKEKEAKLQREISELESRLDLLQKEALNAKKARDALKEETNREIDSIRRDSRREIRKLKEEKFSDKKSVQRENWALETRIQRAEMDFIAGQKELKKEEGVTPMVSSLREALDSVTKRMIPQVEEKKERVNAKEMFFARGLQSLKNFGKEELDEAKMVFEEAKRREEEDLADTILKYELELEEKKRQMNNNVRLAEERGKRDVADAIKAAKKNRIDLYQDKYNAMQLERQRGEKELQEAREAQEAVQDQYDAEYENEKRNLINLRERSILDIQNEEKLREAQKQQLVQEMEQLSLQLEQQLKDDEAAAEAKFQNLQQSKSTELSNSKSRTQRALSDIQTTRANLNLMQEELQRLEKSLRKRDVILKELEDERGSFRKQLRRTLVVGWEKVSLKQMREKRRRRRNVQ